MVYDEHTHNQLHKAKLALGVALITGLIFASLGSILALAPHPLQQATIGYCLLATGLFLKALGLALYLDKVANATAFMLRNRIVPAEK